MASHNSCDRCCKPLGKYEETLCSVCRGVKRRASVRRRAETKYIEGINTPVTSLRLYVTSYDALQEDKEIK